ncbi:hypothetical protein [Methylorubrum extorquens]|uniref:hypothetical protein n=1 Tax=Methylorubrum extorquens TaxID=408 RepID=UPI00223806C1|nr:hypothetical protein [Methylorubrum extorquens]UYW31945.1 hypothetical protein OKB92_23740 [Methylorubrum extorquens]
MTKRKPRTREEVLAHLAEQTAAYRAAHPVRVPREEPVRRTPVRAPVDRDGVGGNGGPPLETPPPSRRGTLHRVGMSLYGERWKEAAAGPVGVSARTLRRYVADVDPVDAPDAVIVAMRRVCLAKIRELHDCIERLDAVVPPTPPTVIHPGVDPEAAAWFLDAVRAATLLQAGWPSFIREVLAVRMPARGRLVEADIVLFDGALFTLEINRGPRGDLRDMRYVTEDGARPRIVYDDEAGVWTRDPDRPWEFQRYGRVAAARPTPAAKPMPSPAVAPVAVAAAPPVSAGDPRQIHVEEYIAAQKAKEG